jgi:hypothetical protein
MSLWSKIRGTLEALFQIGGPTGPQLKNNAGAVEARNSADTAYAVMRGGAPVGDNDLATKTYVDTLAFRTVVSAQFNGNNALPSNSSTEQFYVVTTTGPNATIGQLLWDDGSNAGTVTVLAAASRAIITNAAFSGGTITLAATSEYYWTGAAWALIGPQTATSGVVRTIRFAITNAASQSSASQIPANAFVREAWLEVTTPYSAGGTIAIGQTGTASLLMATGDNVPQTAGTYQLMQDTAWGASALAVLVTVGGSPAAGAGVVLVSYVVPDA